MRIKAPAFYYQEMELLENIGVYSSLLGRRFLIICEKKIFSQMGFQIKRSLESEGIDCKVVALEENYTLEAVMQYGTKCEQIRAEAVIGIGAYQTLDFVKAVGYYAKLPVAVVPTMADPVILCSLWGEKYEDWQSNPILKQKKCPDMVLVDSEIIANSSVRSFVSGMVDALAVYLENKILYTSEVSGRIKKGTIPAAVLAVSRECYDRIVEYGQKALKDVRNHVCTDEVEKVTEAILYLGGIGAENGGFAAAYSIAKGIIYLEIGDWLHGECVSIGILAQMIMNGENEEEFQKMKQFLQSLNVPVCLSDIGVKDIRAGSEQIAKIASDIYLSNSVLPFSMGYEWIAGALMALEGE